MKSRTVLAFMMLGVFVGPLEAAVVLMLSSANPAGDTLIQSRLEGLGHAVTIGPRFSAYNGEGLAAAETVLLLANYNWNSGDMPVAGQNALVDYVQNGGGLVTSEWLVWKTGNGAFASLLPILPANANPQFRTAASATYTKVTPDPVMNAGLPDTFSFPTTNVAGTDTQLTPKAGATVYYGTDYDGGEGVIGWPTGSGKAISFSTLIAENEISDADYARLVSNSLNWTAGKQLAMPEPTCIAIWLFLGLAWSTYRPATGSDAVEIRHSG